MENIISRISNWLSKRDSIYQLIVWIISPIFISNLPTIAFILFMGENKIFSYDFFINGLFGLNIFFIFTTTFTLLYGVLLTGTIIPLIDMIVKRVKKESISAETWFFFIFMFTLNILFQAIILQSTFDREAHTLLCIIGFFVNLHIGVLIYSTPKIKLVTLILLIGAVFYSMFNYHKLTADLIEIGMSKFNTGGNKEIIISSESNKSKIISKGKLILLSPNKIYIRTQDGIEIMERNNKIIKLINDMNITR